MKTVIDTNVLVSGIYYGGFPAKIVDAWLDRAFLVIATRSILSEYIRVIDYLSSKKEPFFKQDWQLLLPKICQLIPEEEKLVPLCRDKGDDKFLYCAFNAKAQYPITGDNDLKELTHPFSFQIITPRQFIHVLSKK